MVKKNKIISINQNSDFKRIYYRGRYKSNQFLTTYLMNNRRNDIRIGITASKKIGNAVKRNRARRIIKASFHQLQKLNDLKGYDYVFVARKDTVFTTSDHIKKVMAKQIALLTGTQGKQNINL